MPAPYDYSSSTGYARTRADWVDFPSTSTPITQAQLDQFDQALRDKKVEFLNVKDYGAKGDGTTNDATAIQNTINAATAYVGGIGGSTIYFPEGVYLVNSAITMPSDGLTLLGSGQRSSVIKGAIAGAIVKNTGSRLYLAVRNMFVQNTSTSSSARAIEFDTGVNDLLLENVNAQSAGGFCLRCKSSNVVKIVGGRYGGAAGPEAAMGFDTCNVIQIRGPSISDAKAGIQLLGVSAVSITAHFEALAGSAPVYDGAITGSSVLGFSVTGCYMEASSCPFFQLYASVGFNRGGYVGGNYTSNGGGPSNINLANLKQCHIGPNAVIPGAIAPNVAGAASADSTTADTFVEYQYVASGTGAKTSLVGATSGYAPGTGGFTVIASATTITIPPNVEMASVTGTTTITSVVAGYPGQRVTLVFTGVLAFTDGSNLKLASTMNTTADDSISLMCDGTNWYETGRSVN